MSASEVLRRIIGALGHSGIAYMLVGSFAAAPYGLTRSTHDIDIVIDPTVQQLQDFIHCLGGDYYANQNDALAALASRDMFNVIDQAFGWKIDLFISADRAYSREAFRRRRLINMPELQGLSVVVASPEDVVISKLEWARIGQSSRQVEDVAAILQRRWDTLDGFYMRHWIAELGLHDQWNLARNAAGIRE